MGDHEPEAGSRVRARARRPLASLRGGVLQLGAALVAVVECAGRTGGAIVWLLGALVRRLAQRHRARERGTAKGRDQRRRDVRPATARALLAAIVGLTFAQALVAAARVPPPRPRPSLVAGAPVAVAAPPASPSLLPPPSAANPPAAPARAARGRAPVAGPDVAMFGGLGAWVDLYDFSVLDPARSVGLMSASGVRTLFIQTGRSDTPESVSSSVGPWIAAAHRAGMKAVGWYLPSYSDVGRDIRRTVDVARYRWRGHRFDGLGIDIEERRGAPSRSEFNRRVVRHARGVRAALGPGYAIAGITPSPLQMRVAPGFWAGFPWMQVASVSDAVMTMSYWSERTGCPREPLHCAYGYSKTDVLLARRLTGGRVPIHIIGGIGNKISAKEVADFARGAREGGAFGASLYDFNTTDGAFWRLLSGLRLL